MSLTLDSAIETRLAVTRHGIEDEFDHLPREQVDARFDRIVAQLLDQATLGDFVPVLAWRYAREELRAVPDLPAEFRG
jgi:hypothetical protein